MSIVSQTGDTRLVGRHREALELLSAGKVKDALLILLELADAQPENHYVCLDLGRAVLGMGMNDQAVVAARRAVELDSADEEGFLLLAQALEALGNYQDACVALSRAVDLLRNPFRAPADLDREELLPPLAVSDPATLFTDFTLKGDVSNLSLVSVSRTGAQKTRIHVVLSGEGHPPPADSQEVGSGEIPRDRLLACLPAELAGAARIFPRESFPYTLFAPAPAK